MKPKQYTTEDLMYICRFYEVDGPDMMAAAFDRSKKSMAELVRRLRKNGLYEQYKKQWDRQLAK